ncbi:putative Calcium-binding EF-hand family protein [Tripterygium wilfordii]|uniref:Putative Calcium-binding EF-hand family protein n=1 Tax=Tripterygium wilfordii TaxID=458696 RepID=A0A7J7DL05_TRIWF|nr:putative Calcium-binding EF-hand family protein [Tripterygium wilfordii]
MGLFSGQLKTIFEEHDINKDGLLSKEELKKAFEKLRAWWPDWRVNRALHHADANGDGIISSSEMDDLVKYAVRLGYKIRT